MKNKELHIVEFGNHLLRKKCKKVEFVDSNIIELIDGMKYLLHRKSGRAAIASSQVGKLLRIVVIDYEKDYCELINPEIIAMIGNEIDYEGCLSFPNFSGRVDRAKEITVKYIDRDMKEKIKVIENSNLSRCYQHEIDHLDGILYIDRVIDDYLVNDKTNFRIDIKTIKQLAG